MDIERGPITSSSPEDVPGAAVLLAAQDGMFWSRALEVAFEAMIDGVIVVDAVGRVVRINTAARTRLGLDLRPEDSFAHRSMAERAAQLDLRDPRGLPQPPQQWVLSRLLNGETLTVRNAVEVVIHTLDGREVQSSLTGAPVRDDAGQVVGAVMVSRDVTERQLLLLAQEEDRRRVAHEVHDGLAQVAASAHQHLQAFASRHRPRSAPARQELERVLELVRRTVTEARHIVANLRPSMLDDAGLASAIGVHVEELRSVGWHITYRETLGAERLPAAVETALFRIAQEALTNVRKHAQTMKVEVVLERAGPIVRLVVRDEGRGFEPDEVPRAVGAGERLGLAGMYERVALLSGRLIVESRPGKGTRVIAEVPLLVVPPEDNGFGE